MKAMITLPEPCSENWEAMTPNEQGRHCALCCHTVIDFSTWALPDIATYLESRKGEKICGRFVSTQLNTPFDLKIFVPEILRWNTTAVRKIAALIVVCFALGASSCSSNHEAAAPAMGIMVSENAMQSDTVPRRTQADERDHMAERDSLKPVFKAKDSRKAKKAVCVAGEPGYTTGGAPLLDYIKEPVVPVPVRFQPEIGPPEEDTTMTAARQ